MNIDQRQNKAPQLVLQLPLSLSDDYLALPRHERWAKAQAEIDALPHYISKQEFRQAQARIWARYEV